MTKRVLSLLLLVTGLFLVAGCVNFEGPKAVYRDYAISRITADGIEVNFLFDVTNPNPIDLTVNQYAYKVTINGKALLDENRPGFTMTANQKKELAIPVLVRYDAVFGSLLSVIQRVAAGNRDVDYQIDGSISASSFGIAVSSPLSSSGKFKLPENIKF
ncbi:MAG: LEA type 2 family protein [Candidatus Margulisiibacteriota bacterium]